LTKRHERTTEFFWVDRFVPLTPCFGAVQAALMCPRTALAVSRRQSFKVKLAVKLRTQTTVTVGLIADRLQMGTSEHAAHLLAGAKNRNLDVDQPTLGI
jgi:hypothetical protein